MTESQVYSVVDCGMTESQVYSVVDCGMTESQVYLMTIGICCFSLKHTALKSKRKDWLLGIRIMYLPVDCCFSELAL